MVIQNVECQISTVLMKRFLDGETLPPDLLSELEQHLRVCPGCQAIVNGDGPSLDEILDGPKVKAGMAAFMGKLTGSQTPGGFATLGPAEALMQASVKTHAPAPGLAAFKNPKVLFLSGALAIVLIAMSTILRNPENLLGRKAASLYAESGAEKPQDEHSTKEQPEEPNTTEEHGQNAVASTESSPEAVEPPVDPIADSTSGSEPTHVVEDPRVPGKPTLDQSELIVATSAGNKTEPKPATPKSQPKPTTSNNHPPKNSGRKPAPRRPAKRPARKPAPQSKGGGGITVYGPDGKPIK